MASKKSNLVSQFKGWTGSLPAARRTVRSTQSPIFLSHASADAKAATAMADWLRSVFMVEVFVSSIAAGEEWRRKIFDSLSGCSVGIILGTVNSVRRVWVHAEIGALLALGKTTVPLFVGEFDPALWSELSDLQYCFYNKDGQAKLIDTIEKALHSPLGASKLVQALASAPAVEIETEPIPVQTRGQHLRPKLLEMIRSAKAAKGELLVAGIANTEFFGSSADQVNAALRIGLAAGMRTRFLFLDPNSASALSRRLMERARLNSVKIIESSLEVAYEVRDHSEGCLQIRLAQNMPVFLCANQASVIFHPYLSSATGATMPIEQQGSHTDLYRYLVEHFENLWGERWVLFDAGNVLIGFDHRRASLALAKSTDPAALAERIHQFIFAESAAGPSRNTLLDLGTQPLSWLYGEVVREFDLALSYQSFEEAWQSIFDDALAAGAVECIRRVRALGVRVAVCSNTNNSHWNRLLSLMPDLCDADILKLLSFEMKLVKSDERFYVRVCELTGRPPQEHLLLDDLDENVAASRKAGFRVVKIDKGLDPAEIERALVQYNFAGVGKCMAAAGG